MKGKERKEKERFGGFAIIGTEHGFEIGGVRIAMLIGALGTVSSVRRCGDFLGNGGVKIAPGHRIAKRVFCCDLQCFDAVTSIYAAICNVL